MPICISRLCIFQCAIKAMISCVFKSVDFKMLAGFLKQMLSHVSCFFLAFNTCDNFLTKYLNAFRINPIIEMMITFFVILRLKSFIHLYTWKIWRIIPKRCGMIKWSKNEDVLKLMEQALSWLTRVCWTEECDIIFAKPCG